MSSLVLANPSLFGNPWTAVSAGSSVNPVVANTLYAADSTGSQSTFVLPSAPSDGFTFAVKLVGATVANGVAFTASGSDTVESPMIPGTFSSAAGTVLDQIVGDMVAYKYQSANTRWVRFV